MLLRGKAEIILRGSMSYLILMNRAMDTKSFSNTKSSNGVQDPFITSDHPGEETPSDSVARSGSAINVQSKISALII